MSEAKALRQCPKHGKGWFCDHEAEPESLKALRLTVDEYSTVWLGEPGEGTAVGDLTPRDEETLQIEWR